MRRRLGDRSARRIGSLVARWRRAPECPGAMFSGMCRVRDYRPGLGGGGFFEGGLGVAVDVGVAVGFEVGAGVVVPGGKMPGNGGKVLGKPVGNGGKVTGGNVLGSPKGGTVAVG